jgi:transposase InsO family protein
MPRPAAARRQRERAAEADRRRGERDERLKQRVLRAYTLPGHPVAFSAPQRVADYFHISPARATRILQETEGYTLHREYKQPRVYNPIYVRGRRKQVQADLIDVSKVAPQNDDVRFLLVLIDIFTKRVWVYPLKRKDAGRMKTAVLGWLNSLDVVPEKVVTDRGTEFTNAEVRGELASHRVAWEPANGTLKACIAERVNKTLQILIYKYMSENETHRYLEVLDDLVDTYNRRPHRTLEGMSPEEADDPRNEARVLAIFNARYEKLARRRREPKYKVGDMVRVKTDPKKISSSARAYAEQFHGEYFNIIRINRTLPVPMYYLRSADTGELIEGGFYANELQQLRGEVYKIESVLDRRRAADGTEELFVKWKYFGENWNEWIPADSVTRVY